MNINNTGGGMKQASCARCKRVFPVSIDQVPPEGLVTNLKEAAELLARGGSPLILVCGECLQAIAEIHRIQRSN